MDTEAILRSLRETGIAALQPIDEIEPLYSWFNQSPVYVDAHMPHTAIERGDSPVAWGDDRAAYSECVCVPLATTICAPFLFDHGLALRDIAVAYLGTDRPLAYSMNAFWTRPGPAGTRPDIQEFHRDMDDPKGFLAMFVYLTDVLSDEDGPHELRGPDGIARKVYGPTGTVFLADTSHEHRGLKPTRSHRGLAWFRWGVSDPPDSYVWDKNEPIDARALGDRFPRDSVSQDAVHLLAVMPK